MIKNEIKALIVNSGMTMSDVIDGINKKYNKTESLSNLSNKLTRGTLKYREVLEIADIIGYEIKWVKKNTVK